MNTKISAIILTIATIWLLYHAVTEIPTLFVFALLFILLGLMCIDMYRLFVKMIERFKAKRDQEKELGGDNQ